MRESTWNGFKRIDFEFMERTAILIFPNEKNRCNKWLLKTEYFDAFPDMEIEMLKKGWHLAYISNITRWCIDEDLDVKKAFADYLIKEYKLAKKCVPVGMSCGGMIAVKFAARYPEYVACLYLDAPVMNLLSCPCGLGRAGDDMYQEFKEATGKTVADLINYREHPIDCVPSLLEHNIQIFLVAGDEDCVVPYEENGKLLYEYYKEHGGDIQQIIKRGCGHHPHGLGDNSLIVEFIMKADFGTP